MKTMRNALLAVGVLAAMIGSASAQSVDPFANEIDFQGQFNVDAAFTDPSTGATLPAVISGAGYLTSGALIPEEIFQNPPVTNSQSNAHYTYTLTNLTFAGFLPGTTSTNINAQYTGGILNVYYDVTPDQTYTGSTAASMATFSDGQLVLTGNVSVDSTFFVTGPDSGFGSISGQVQFTGGGPYTEAGGNTYDLYQILVNNKTTVGLIEADTNTRGRQGDYEFTAAGNVNIIPEPTTMALLGAGLLPMGMFLRRRRS